MNRTFFPNKIIQIIVLLVLSLLLASPVIYFFGTEPLVNVHIYRTLFFILTCSIFIGIVVFKNRKRHKVIDLDFKLMNRKLLFKSSFMIVMLSIGFIIPVNILIHRLTNSELIVNNPFDNIWMILGAIILTPFFDEIVFRGIILKGLLKSYSPWFSISFSTLLFGLIHINPTQILSAIFVGLLLGWIYYKTRSIVTVMLLHSIGNLVTLLTSYWLYKHPDFTNLTILSIILIAISIPKGYTFIRRLKLDSNLK